MFRFVILLLVLLTGGLVPTGRAALAQEFPALFKVVDVAADDVLNIREQPDARAPILGAFSRDATGIEVVALSEDGGWGLVRHDERSGWSSMRFLRREHEASWQDAQLPLSCLGTEPFWSLALDLPSSRARYEGLVEGAADLVTEAPALSRTAFPATLAIPFDGARRGFVVLRGGLCSDGMSDRLYGLEAQIYWRGQPQGLSGCCHLGG